MDRRGHFHSIWHAFRGQENTYPRDCHTPDCNAPTDSDGCHRTQPCNETTPGMQGGCVNGSQWPGPCTALGGHAYSIDGRQWYISPVAPFNATTLFEDGSVVMWRARERPHVILNAKGAILVVYEYTIDIIVDRSTVQCGIHRQIDAITTAAYGNFNLTSQ